MTQEKNVFKASRLLQPTRAAGRVRKIAVHGVRALLFTLILALIHDRYARHVAEQKTHLLAPVELEQVLEFYPTATQIDDLVNANGSREVYDAAGKLLGYFLQTSPQSDHILGFSGPTNMLIAFGPDDRITRVRILSSRDTRDHVNQVRQEDRFFKAFRGQTWEEAATKTNVDAVSGATLTSLAIQEAIIHRLGGDKPSLRFPDPLTLDEARRLFADAVAVEVDKFHRSLWHVKNNSSTEIGTILRTSPSADQIIGYQGPTETLIGFGRDQRVVGILLGQSYDNDRYVAYVRANEYFLSRFNDMVLAELAKLDLKEAEVEGVSGATMTSMAVAQGLVLATTEHRHQLVTPHRGAESRGKGSRGKGPPIKWALRDIGTAAVVLAGLAVGFTSLRSNRVVRLSLQLLLIGYLGLINGDMLSQALIAGWSQNGVPWRNAGGLVLLTIAAFLVPLTTHRNIYCTHLCPHGAAQQLLKKRLPWQLHLPRWLKKFLQILPAALIVWSVVVAMAALPFSLVDIEPFDAWVFRVAGWATITIAIVGLIASLFVPMAYCRYGCPTGAILSFLRFNSGSDRWARRDWMSLGLLVLAVVLWRV